MKTILNEPETMGQEIRRRRKALDLTQGELAQLLHTGQSQLARWERGAVMVSVRWKQEIIQLLEIKEAISEHGAIFPSHWKYQDIVKFCLEYVMDNIDVNHFIEDEETVIYNSIAKRCQARDCQNLFKPRGNHKKYCSERCRNREGSRRHRGEYE